MFQFVRVIPRKPFQSPASLTRVLAIVLAWLLAGCAGMREEPPMLALDSESVGFTEIELQARETRRNERGSAVEFIDHNTGRGTQLAKDAFRLRALATVAARRGYDYFVVLDRSADNRSFLLGMLPAPDADFGDTFGDAYADLPRAGVLEVRKLAPFASP